MTAPGRPAIGPAQATDAVRYAKAAERFFRQTYGHDPSHSAVMDRHCADTFIPARIGAELSDPGVIALIATSGPDIAALTQMQIDGDEGKVQRFYVDNVWHGRGVAQSLMDRLADAAMAAGVRTLSLGVWEQNERALAFYHRQGFVAFGRVEFLLNGVPQSDVMLRRTLGPPTVCSPGKA